MKPVYLLFVSIFLLVACMPETTADPPPTPAAVATAPIIPSEQETASNPRLDMGEPMSNPAPVIPTALPTSPPEESVDAALEPAVAAVTPELDESELPTAPDSPVAPVVTESAGTVVSGRTAEGAFFRGAPDAPVTLIDYSDFL